MTKMVCDFYPAGGGQGTQSDGKVCEYRMGECKGTRAGVTKRSTWRKHDAKSAGTVGGENKKGKAVIGWDGEQMYALSLGAGGGGGTWLLETA